MELEAPARVVAVLLGDRLRERGAETRMRAGVRGDLARERGERVVWRRARRTTSARCVLKEKRIASPVVGCARGARRARRCAP